MNRGNRPVQPNTPAAETSSEAPKTPGFKPSSLKTKAPGKWLKLGYIGFLAAIAVLLLAVVLSLAFPKTSTKETSYVDTGKMQAVFLNGGQVYFGKITDLNNKYLSLSNIYYLRVNQQVQPDQQNAQNANDISLVKLGCELHGPEDTMVIYREQVIFWENLKSDGQVAKAVDEYVKANPDGQNCEQQQQQSQSTGNTETKPANNANGAANNNATNSGR